MDVRGTDIRGEGLNDEPVEYGSVLWRWVLRRCPNMVAAATKKEPLPRPAKKRYQTMKSLNTAQLSSVPLAEPLVPVPPTAGPEQLATPIPAIGIISPNATTTQIITVKVLRSRPCCCGLFVCGAGGGVRRIGFCLLLISTQSLIVPIVSTQAGHMPRHSV
jgi:hypothetical protein